ncbi:hypothetical protein GE107_06750 [Cohnella sp. CFH 77786]|uniref:stalk domain-containing protein n=1 Tax=Cohnella sp. CFH 77786 TaxID=2662265 RepID=UPI001C609F2D|nr:stalk domain-containing protein [Cohnella sp. CFH 77786]MBW5445764.1 hypothetical protein [Cohnella sp. CFH 77786]
MFAKMLSAIVVVSIAFGLHEELAHADPGKDLRIIPVIVNGQKVRFPDTEPYINTDGRTMVPVRFVSEMLGANVKWEAGTQSAIINYEGKTIQMSVGSQIVMVNGQVTELDTAAEFTDGRTMVPLRFVSEVLGSTVEWDDGAHAVKVTDAKYQTKIDAGEVKLDPWGREYSKNYDANWMKLTDLESAKFYDFYGAKPSRYFLEPKNEDVAFFKETADVLSSKIRKYYEAQLNIDYRTVDADKLIQVLLDSSSGVRNMNAFYIDQTKKMVADYVSWVKKNKVVARGYADPEMSSVYKPDNSGLMFWVPTHFKFMIISADDTAQTFLDNYKVSSTSDSFKLKKGVWYDGYSVVSMTTNVANSTWGKSYGIRHTENMFYKNSYFYNVVE